MKFIIGLGNPGLQYRKTRHNAGFMFLNHLAKDLCQKKLIWKLNKNLRSKTTEIELENQTILLIKPQTFMNLSGQIIPFIKKKYPQFDAKDLFLIYDDIDLPLGKIRIKNDGSAGGHNGVKSIIQHLGGQDFARLKIGISNELRDKIPAEKFVLQKFGKQELEALENIFIKSPQIIQDWLTKDEENLKQIYN